MRININIYCIIITYLSVYLLFILTNNLYKLTQTFALYPEITYFSDRYGDIHIAFADLNIEEKDPDILEKIRGLMDMRIYRI